MKYDTEANRQKMVMLQAQRRAIIEAKAKAFDKIKALVEAPDHDGVLARIREAIAGVNPKGKQ